MLHTTVLLAVLGALPQTPAPSKTASSACAALASTTLPDVRITSADAVAAKPDGVPVPHCKVLGIIGAEIQFQVLLPDAWNGRFVMGGNGGFAGSLENDFSSVTRGYAFAGTDTGHQASAIQAGWALGHPDRLANYGHIAVHRTAETAKALVRAYYGRAAQYSYFDGCSNGGRQALMEAQRYPQDFDGLLAGAPAYDFTNIAGAFVKNIKAVFPVRDSARTPAVSADNLALIERAALDACDASDGVRDNVIGTPDTCRFSLASVRSCPQDTAAPDCLTTKQRRAIAAIYAPAKAGTLEIYPGWPVGGENDEYGWRLWITGIDQGLLAGTNGQASSLQLAFGPELFKYMVFANPDWDYTTYDLANWGRDTKAVAPILNADNPDLSGLKARGGKLIIWHGWADPALNAVSTLNYYKRVQQHDPTSSAFTRLYLLPGVEHCNGGSGPSRVDWLTAITDWVEKGKAPTRLVSSKMGAAGQPVRTRPVCPYPQRAVYKGSGSTDEEQNFACK
jgi:tannase/feruloyl esterase